VCVYVCVMCDVCDVCVCMCDVCVCVYVCVMCDVCDVCVCMCDVCVYMCVCVCVCIMCVTVSPHPCATHTQTHAHTHTNNRGDPISEVYEPRFTYHGFRYVAVYGLPNPPSVGTIVGIHVRSSVQSTGAVRFSNEGVCVCVCDVCVMMCV